jgi:trk system potassium uptake protein TrkA
MYVIVVGGGNVGTQLAKRLIARDHEVLLLEKDSRQASKLAGALGDQFVLAGDGCELHIQKAAGFSRADVVVAATGEDEDNLVVCQLAKHQWNVERVLARVNDPGHEEIFRELGIDDTVSATRLIFNLIDQQLETDELVPVGALHRGHVEVVESVLSARSPLVGTQVRDIALPTGTFLVYLFRDGQGSAVDGDTELQANDMLVALVPIAHAEELRKVLSADV